MSIYPILCAFEKARVCVRRAERIGGGVAMGEVRAATQQQQHVEDQLFLYLNGLLEQVEASSGVDEPELKAKIAALRTESRKTPAASSSQMSEVEVTRELECMSAKLNTLDVLVKEASVDPQVQSLLASSADLWVPVITASAEDRQAKATVKEEVSKTP